MQSEYFTWTSLGMLTTASGAVIVVTNTLRNALGLDRPWIPLVIALTLSFGFAWHGNQLNDLASALLAALNACLLFCTATGANETIVRNRESASSGIAKPQVRKNVAWWGSWLP